MKNSIPNGVWPTMVTPFDPGSRIDYRALGRMIEWYVEMGVAGLFAVCQSSEMFFLTREERTELARFVVREAGGKVPVIASGHVSDLFEDQIEDIKGIASTGVDAVVLLSNRLALQEESDVVWLENAARILDTVPEVTFGIYECPHPYKRLMSADTLGWCAASGRFSFLKDTSCNPAKLKEKINRVKGGNLKVFNANSATLLESLHFGAAGFSGVMANFHPDLYAWLIRNWQTQPERAKELQHFLSQASMAEYQYYPVNAKYHLQLSGIPVGLDSRTRDAGKFTVSMLREIEGLKGLTDAIRQLYL